MRTKAYPAYKAQRAERRANDATKEETYQQVHRFITTIWEIPYLNRCFYPGLEADDIVGLLAWMHGPIDLLGVDKDLFQLGDRIARMTRVGGEEVGLESFFKKLPVRLQAVQRTPENVLFLLATMGDKSDNIVRLIPPYKLDGFVEILFSKNKWHDAYFKWGEEFLLNLYMVMVPFPGLFGLSPIEALDLVAKGQWRPGHNLWARLEMFHPSLYRDLKQRSNSLAEIMNDRE
jgi:hypothetical protein